MFPLLCTWFHCHVKEPPIEFTYVLIVSLTSTAVLGGRDPLTFGKWLRRPAFPPFGTIRLYSPSFNFPVLLYELADLPG